MYGVSSSGIYGVYRRAIEMYERMRSGSKGLKSIVGGLRFLCTYATWRARAMSASSSTVSSSRNIRSKRDMSAAGMLMFSAGERRRL